MIDTGKLVGQHIFTFTPDSESKMDIMVWNPEKNGADVD